MSGNVAAAARPRVAIVGAGFGGLSAARALRDVDVDVTVINRTNHYLFQPLLYQVAAGVLSPADIAMPTRFLLRRQRNATVLMADVGAIDVERRTIDADGLIVPFDFLIVATGARHAYFNHPEWEPLAPGLKTLEDARLIRHRFLHAFEEAEKSSNPADQEALLTFVIVGGGPTGVELAGAFAELTRIVLHRDFKRIDPSRARVVMIEAGPRVLAQFSPELSASAERQLKKLGVEVRTATKVKSISLGRVDLESGEIIFAENIIWAAGVSASPLTNTLGVELDRAGRVKVNPDLSLPGHPEVFAIGDMALVLGEDGKPTPGVSPAAMQMAKHVARLIESELVPDGKTGRAPFRYRDKGSMATIGRSAAVAKVGRFEFSGFPAWLVWLGVHLIFLIGFRNKVAVLLQWAYSYLTYKRGARIITGLSDEIRR